MHDIMHDFANFLSRSEHCFILDGGLEAGKHSSHQREDVGEVRSFTARYVSQEELTPDLFSRLKRLRVLIMNNCDLKELPKEVGKLIHLRYLDLSDIPIRELPEAVCDLHNLQTLDLEGCRELSALPEGIHKLINLRHLLICMAPRLQKLPQGLEKLTSLWTLNRFEAGRGSSKLGYLQNLNQLRGCLFLYLNDMYEVDDLVEAEKAGLKNKIYILELHIFFHGQVSMDVMDALQSPPNLQCLRFCHYDCRRFPDWIISLNNLRALDIDHYENCSSLPPLSKLPMLEKLTVFDMDNMKCVGNEFLGIDENLDGLSTEAKFPKLKKLCFSWCRDWEQWEDLIEEDEYSFSIMPCLQEIEIIECPNLKALPHRLLHQATSLEVLTISDSKLLVERYKKGSGDYWDMISHIPNVKTEIRGRILDHLGFSLKQLLGKPSRVDS